MKLEKYEALGIISVLLFGAVIGGAVTYNQMDSRLENLEQRVSELSSQDRPVYSNTSAGYSLVDLFESVDQSVVSVQTTGPSSGVGSGFVYSKKGYIVTNAHVVKGAES
ncbi:MAG: hypothetical protein ABEJ66_03875, partial [Candidatus Nanohaloarchaea archaeon]